MAEGNAADRLDVEPSVGGVARLSEGGLAMRSSFVSRGGFPLMKSPNYRHRAARRRLMAICAVLGLALVSGLIGVLTAPKGRLEVAQSASTGPFSYVPHQ